jgi:type I restriction enzyme S subunit
MTEQITEQFGSLFAEALRNGVSYPSRQRGTGVAMVNMREIFAYDRIADQECELAPLTGKELDRYELEAGDLLFARQSLTYDGAGRCVMVMPSENFRTWESHLIRVKLDSGRADPGFYYYYFRSNVGRRSMESIIQQVAAAGIRGSDLSRLKVPVPPIEKQRAIAQILGTIDDKIAANTDLVSTVDSMAQTMFRSALDSSLMSPLSATAEFVNGKAFTKGASGTGRVVVRIAELNSGLGGSTVYSDAEVDNKHVVRAGDTLFAWSGSLTLHRWYRDDAIVNQHIFKVTPKAGNPNWLVFQLISAKLADFKSIAADKATTMGHIQRHHLDEVVAVPAPDAMARIDAAMSALWQRGLAAEQESSTLVKLRDTLLPELMSGRLRVKDAEKKIEEVV